MHFWITFCIKYTFFGSSLLIQKYKKGCIFSFSEFFKQTTRRAEAAYEGGYTHVQNLKEIVRQKNHYCILKNYFKGGG
jgi:hypothetical protein